MMKVFNYIYNNYNNNFLTIINVIYKKNNNIFI